MAWTKHRPTPFPRSKRTWHKRRGGGTFVPSVTWPASPITVDSNNVQSVYPDPGLEYEYRLYESLSREYIGELPVSYCSFSRTLNAPGGGDLHLPLRTDLLYASGETVNKMLFDYYEEYALSLIIVRNGVPVHECFLARTRSNSLDGRVGFALVGLWDFFRNRFIRPSVKYVDMDKLEVIRNLITHAQTSQPSSDLGVQVGTELSGEIITLDVPAWEFQYYGDVIEDFAQQDLPSDFRIDTTYGPGEEVVRTLKLGSPRLGQRRELILEWGRNIESYQWSRDGSTRATRYWGVGAGEGRAAVVALSEDTSTFGNVPLREAMLTRKEIPASQKWRLQGLVNYHRRTSGQPIEMLSCRCISDASDSLVGSFVEGDSLPVLIDDGFTQIDKYMRVMSYTVDIQSDGSESISFDLAPESAVG